MNEQDILSAPAYGAEPLTLDEQANDLVNAFMHQLRTVPEFQYAIDGMKDERKAAIHSMLLVLAKIGLEGGKFIEQTVPQPKPGHADKPLGPEPEGQVFQVQVGGLLLSEQVKG